MRVSVGQHDHQLDRSFVSQLLRKTESQFTLFGDRRAGLLVMLFEFFNFPRRSGPAERPERIQIGAQGTPCANRCAQ